MQDIEIERREVVRLGRRLLAMIEATEPPAACALAPLRWELMRRLFALLMFEQVMSGDRREASRELLARWKLHTGKWTGERIGAEWHGYSREAKQLLAKVVAHCSGEAQAAA